MIGHVQQACASGRTALCLRSSCAHLLCMQPPLCPARLCARAAETRCAEIRGERDPQPQHPAPPTRGAVQGGVPQPTPRKHRGVLCVPTVLVTCWWQTAEALMLLACSLQTHSLHHKGVCAVAAGNEMGAAFAHILLPVAGPLLPSHYTRAPRAMRSNIVQITDSSGWLHAAVMPADQHRHGLCIRRQLVHICADTQQAARATRPVSKWLQGYALLSS